MMIKMKMSIKIKLIKANMDKIKSLLPMESSSRTCN